jgi:hypothetical protein
MTPTTRKSRVRIINEPGPMVRIDYSARYEHWTTLWVYREDIPELIGQLAGLVNRPLSPARGEGVAQTVEGLQAILMNDAEVIDEMAAEISSLKQKINKLQQRQIRGTSQWS